MTHEEKALSYFKDRARINGRTSVENRRLL